MNRAKVLLIICFVLALAAGWAAGLASDKVKPPRREGGPPWLSRELNLTSQQEEQMKAIWSNIGAAGRTTWEQRRTFEREREEAIRNLFTPEQLAQYEAITREFAARNEQLNRQRHQAFEQAQEQTRALLTPEQRERYDKLLANGPRQRERRFSRESDGGGTGFSGRRSASPGRYEPGTNAVDEGGAPVESNDHQSSDDPSATQAPSGAPALPIPNPQPISTH